MTKDEALRHAGRVIDKACNTGKAFAIFLVAGQIKVTATTTDLFKTKFAKDAKDLIGVYDERAHPNDIVEDILYCTGVTA